jgi:uncharacterized protein YjbI with pentapeptide repeats
MKMRDERLEKVIELHKKWLASDAGGSRATLIGADLIGADLSRADLSRADLRGADLRGADLSRVDLRDADLRGADMRGADLRGADLSRADLRDADLRDADMRGVNLSRADLRDADLRGAELRGAELDFSSWPLWCGAKGARVDARIAAQLLTHALIVDCDEPEFRAIQQNVQLRYFCNKYFHRIKSGDVALPTLAEVKKNAP